VVRRWVARTATAAADIWSEDSTLRRPGQWL